MMATEQRASIFAEDDALDLGSFKPKEVARQPVEVVNQAAAKAGFVSREPKRAATAPVAPARATQRRRRTGRNAQLNLKAKPETITQFCAVADAQGWVLGEALEKAVELLSQTYGPKAS
jgi:hypothetical protein